MSSDSFAHSWVYFTAAIVNAPALAASQGGVSPTWWPAPLPSLKEEGGSKCHLGAAIRPVMFACDSIQPVGGFLCPSSSWGCWHSLLQELGPMAEVTRRHCYLSPLVLAQDSLHISLTATARAMASAKLDLLRWWVGPLGRRDRKEKPHIRHKWETQGGRVRASLHSRREGVFQPPNSSRPSCLVAVVVGCGVGSSKQGPHTPSRGESARLRHLLKTSSWVH